MKTDMVSFASSGEFVPKLKKKKTESEESDVRNSKWSKWIFPCINIFIRTFAQLSNTDWSKRFRVFDLSQLSCVNFEKWYHRWKTVEVLVLSPVSSNIISTKWTRYQKLSKNRTQQPNDVRKMTLVYKVLMMTIKRRHYGLIWTEVVTKTLQSCFLFP